jgi:hypothetical protein
MWIQMGAALHSHICAATAATARFFADQEVKMIIALHCEDDPSIARNKLQAVEQLFHR